jgi:hypothetical protein
VGSSIDMTDASTLTTAAMSGQHDRSPYMKRASSVCLLTACARKWSCAEMCGQQSECLTIQD